MRFIRLEIKLMNIFLIGYKVFIRELEFELAELL